MENSSKNNLFKKTLLLTETNTNINTTLLKTVPTTEIINIIGGEKKQNDIQEIYDRYNNLKKKINLFLNNDK